MDLLTRQQYWLQNKNQKQHVLKREIYLQQELKMEEITSYKPVSSNWIATKRASEVALSRAQQQEEERKVSNVTVIVIVC
jgi:hypothetical protein